MTHTTSIPLAADLCDRFAEARGDASARLFKINIQDEVISITAEEKASGTFEADYRALVAKHLEDHKPAYVLVRLDDKVQTGSGYEWAFLSWVPDGSPVRDRMIYAASRDPLKKSLGSSYFSADLFGTQADEFTFDAYSEATTRGQFAAVALTNTELLAQREAAADFADGPTKEYVHSVAFPVGQSGQDALRAIGSGSVGLVHLRLDLDKEGVELEKQVDGDVSLDSLASHLPTDRPAYIFFRWSHEDREGAKKSAVLFVFSCPDGAKVKEKMLYATVKSTVTACYEQLKVDVAARVEVQDPAAEINNDLFMVSVYGEAKIVEKPTFSKPSRPGKGGRRLIK